MTSEKRFASLHTGFWNALLPLEETYIRTQNSRLSVFSPGMISVVHPDGRAVVNECAFLLFAAGLDRATHPEDLPKVVVEVCAIKAFEYIDRMHRTSRVPLAPINLAGIQEAKVLAGRLASFFAVGDWQDIRPKPHFPGCGWVDDAEGDVLADNVLIEIKAGERQFRGTDVRQLLCYCALSFSSKAYDIDSVILLNPRSGMYFQDRLETMCQKIAGMSASDVLGEITNYISEPFSRYATG